MHSDVYPCDSYTQNSSVAVKISFATSNHSSCSPHELLATIGPFTVFLVLSFPESVELEPYNAGPFQIRLFT